MGGDNTAAARSTDRAARDAHAGPESSARVLLLTPRWARDGGVGAHLVASAGALAAAGDEVVVAAARIESDARTPGVTLLHTPQLLKRHLPIEERLGEALTCEASLAHLHQVDDPDVVAALQVRTPVVVSAHGYTACTSGVHYFRAGHECTRAHGPGCVPNLIACSHSRDPRSLPERYRHATR